MHLYFKIINTDMKSFIYKGIILAVFLTIGCERLNNDLNLESIVQTEWLLSRIIDNETGEVKLFPQELDKFIIIFKDDGLIELPGYCNYSFGHYELIGNDSLLVYDLGPATKKYCLPDLHMEWEVLFIHTLAESKSYSIDGNQLIIHCQNDYNLVFDYRDQYDKGSLLVCTNSNLMNCVWEIDFSVNNISYSINAGSTYPDYSCRCSDTLNIGLLLELEEGTYQYIANELNCIADNKVNSWSGQVVVSTDSCSEIYLDIFQE